MRASRQLSPLARSGVPSAARSAPRIASGAPRARSASRRLIDGGVVNDTPISHAVELGAERISILPTHAPQERPPRIPTARSTRPLRVRLLVGCRFEADLARYSAEAELIMLPAPNAGYVQPTSFEHSHRLITDARAAARTALERSTRRAHLRLVS